MLSISNEFRLKVLENSHLQIKAVLTFADGTSCELTGEDFIENSATFSSGTSSAASFDIGAAVIGSFSVTLNNFDRRYDDYDFTNATIKVWVGEDVSTGTEWLLKGIYTIEQPNSYGGTISISALDNMQLLEKDFSEVEGIVYPITMGNLVRTVCDYCKLSVVTTGFANSGLFVQSAPSGNLTCLDVVGHVSQATCNYAYINPEGRLAFGWYDADNFTAGQVHTLEANQSLQVVTDDVVITGVDVTACNEVTSSGTTGEDGETIRSGAEGYVLSVDSNPLIAYGHAQEFADAIGKRVVGLTFRPFSASTIGDPSMEAGDACVLIDNRGNKYNSYITNLTYKIGNYASVSCGAETPSRNSASSFSATTNAIQAARQLVKAEQTARENALENMMASLEDSSGLYTTQEKQSDGSVIYYMHDKSTLEQSLIIWKLTSNVFAISNDGGKTYPYALDVNGDAILNRIYAVGIDADYITTGTISGRDNNGSSWNIDTGHFNNTIKQVESDVLYTGVSKTLGTEDNPCVEDAVFNIDTETGYVNEKYTTILNEDKTTTGLYITKNNFYCTYEYNPIYASNGGSVSIYSSNRSPSLSQISIGIHTYNTVDTAKDPSTWLENNIDLESVSISEGIIPGASESILSDDGLFTLFVFEDEVVMEKNTLIARVEWQWTEEFKENPPSSIDLALWIGIDDRSSDEYDVYHRLKLYSQESFKYSYPYTIDVTKKMYVKIAMTPDVLFGVYESYAYIYKYYSRQTNTLKGAFATEEVKDEYIGGFTVVDGSIRFIAEDDWELKNGQRIKSFSDSVAIVPKDNPYGLRGAIGGRGIFLSHGENPEILLKTGKPETDNRTSNTNADIGYIHVTPNSFYLEASGLDGIGIEAWEYDGVGILSLGNYMSGAAVWLQSNSNHMFFIANDKKVAELYPDGTLVTRNGRIRKPTETDDTWGDSLVIDTNGSLATGQTSSDYPVGSCYMTFDSSFLPAAWYGGTWERLDEHLFMGLFIYKRTA